MKVMYIPEPVSVLLFGTKVFTDVIKLTILE